MEEGGGADRVAATAARSASPDIERSCHQAATLAAVEPSGVAAWAALEQHESQWIGGSAKPREVLDSSLLTVRHPRSHSSQH